MDPVLHCAYKAAQVSDTTVLLQGETGTGKQVLARAIHSLDQKRCRFGFITVHCSTVSETLAENELFGHRKGSFSGADTARAGLFQAADKGTIFLDDINDLPLCLQPKPGDLHHTPLQVAPYHLRLDWLMWFLPFRAAVTEKRGYALRRRALVYKLHREAFERR